MGHGGGALGGSVGVRCLWGGGWEGVRETIPANSGIEPKNIS